MNFRFLSVVLICLSFAASAQEPDVRRDATVNAVEQVMPTVVNIATRGKEPIRDVFEQFRRQVLLSAKYLLRQQVRADNDFNTPARAVLGAMPNSTIERSVRIDMVQHTCSAMLRAIPLLLEETAK